MPPHPPIVLPAPAPGPRPPAAHVQAALSAAQAKGVPAPAARPLAAHVQAAVGAAQPKLGGPPSGARPVAQHVGAALAQVTQARMPGPFPGLKPLAAKIGAVAPTHPGPGVLQRAAAPAAAAPAAAAPDYAEIKVGEAKDSGARLAGKADEWIDLDSVKRTYFSWFSKKILSNLGVGPKPANGSICPMCGQAGSNFELDHMTPWRHYIAVFMSKGFIKTSGSTTLIRGDAAKTLYNDPNNLWWICHDCNNPKSDIIPETAAHASGDFSSGTYGRSSGYAPSDVMDDAV
jgi:hypothetical protein